MDERDKLATSQAALQWAASYLGEHGIRDARMDAELLLAHCLVQPRLQFYLEPQRPLAADERERFAELISRRGRREPLQYITGRQEFMSLEFLVSPAVLIPRADTEMLVETALSWARNQARSLRILDLCTGSGAVAVSLAHYLEGSDIWAGDISAAAIEVARANAERLGTHVCFAQGDLTGPFRGAVFDLITANPPYIPRDDICGLEPEVGVAEPKLALDGGQDGLDFYRRLAVEATPLLGPGGKVMLEIGWDEGPQVQAILTEAGFTTIKLIKDYAGRDRVVTASRPPTQDRPPSDSKASQPRTVPK